MPDIAPIALNPTSMPELPESSAASGSDSTFGTILSDKLAASRAAGAIHKNSSKKDSLSAETDQAASGQASMFMLQNNTPEPANQQVLASNEQTEETSSVATGDTAAPASALTSQGLSIYAQADIVTSAEGNDTLLAALKPVDYPLQFAGIAKILGSQDAGSVSENLANTPAGTENQPVVVPKPAGVSSPIAQEAAGLVPGANISAAATTGSGNNPLDKLLADKNSQGTITIQLASGMTSLEDLNNLHPASALLSQNEPTAMQISQQTVPEDASSKPLSAELFATLSSQSAPDAAPASTPSAGSQLNNPAGTISAAQPETTDKLNSGQAKTVEKSQSAFDTLHDTMKASRKVQSEEKATSQDASGQQTSEQNTASMNQQISSKSSDTATNSLAAFSTSLQAGTTTTGTTAAGNSATSSSFYSSSMLSEESLFQQIQEKFHLNTNANGTRLSLKLHPEELGALKIDLSIKEGVVRAHVVAQSPQVQEILEKNMPKLKSILESQGFSVEDVQVRHHNDTVSDFSFSDQQMARDQSEARFGSKPNKDHGFSMQLDDSIAENTSQMSGVNIEA